MGASAMSAAAINRLVVSNIKRARIRADFDQGRFAMALGISKPRLCDIEGGAAVIGCDLIIRAAEVLRLDVPALFAPADERRAA